MVVTWIMGNPQQGESVDDLNLNWDNVLRSQGTLWTWGPAFREEMDEDDTGNQ